MVLYGGTVSRSEVRMIEEPIKITEAPTQKEMNLWAEYERRKAELPRDMKPFDYLDACRKIARELGI